MRRIKHDLLYKLCEEIRKQTIAIYREGDNSEHEKHLMVYKHIGDADKDHHWRMF